MFRIKICGVTNVPDAIAAADAGADAIGLNFYEKSARCVTSETAAAITAEFRRWKARGRKPRKEQPEFWLERFDPSLERQRRPTLSVVGVFVNHPADRIKGIYNDSELTGIQLHGDEPAEAVAEVSFAPIIRARRFDDRGVAGLAADLDECRAAGRCPNAILVDAHTPGRYGGTGETVSWVRLADHRKWLGDTPLILAGGLTPDNVAEAIRIVRPHGVDVASGVETAPGKKDPHKVRDFIAAARSAFDAL
jgi:phosphoribosylanthranilate isomerase